MRKTLLLALSGLKKAKGPSLMLLAVLLIAAALLQLSLIVAFDYMENFDRRAELTRAEDAVFSFQTRDEEKINGWQEIIASDPRTAETQTLHTLCTNLSFTYGDGEVSVHTILLPADVTPAMGQYRFTERAAKPSQDAIYLPLLFHTGGKYALGDEFRIRIKAKDYRFTVSGFYENALTGSQNTGIVSFLLAPEAYNTLDRETDIQGVLLSVRLKEGADSTAYASEIGEKMSVTAHNLVQNRTNYDIARSMRTMTAQICSMIFLGLSLLIAAIALVITAFRISNNIEQEMRSYGALQAVGYTTWQIAKGILTQFLLLGALAVLLGAAAGYALLPILGNLFMVQTGLLWEYGFHALPTLITAAAILVTVALTALLALSKLRRIPTVTALRQGIATHSFKRNPLPLDKARGNVTCLIALKTFFQNAKQNIAVFVIMSVVAFACVFMSVMLHSFAIDTSAAIGFLGGETTDCAVNTFAEDSEEIYAKLKARPEVARVYRYATTSVMWGKDQLSASVVDDCKNLENPGVCYDGRLPEFDNEVALGGLAARARGTRIGDTITLTQGGNSADYLVTGLTQSANNAGFECILRQDGYQRMNPSPSPGSFYVVLKDGYDIPAFLNDVVADYGEKIVITANIREVVKGTFGMFTAIVSGLVLVLTAVLFAIIALVLYLMVKTMLIRRRQQFGVQKALGFTTSRLVAQTVLSFLPSVLAATIFGIALGTVLINPLLSVLFTQVGIIKAMFPVPAGLTIAFGAMVLVFAVGVSALIATRVRRIAPCALLTNE